MSWLDGERLMTFKEGPLEQRNRVAKMMYRAWWHPFADYGAIHGDPHLGNYTIRADRGEPVGVNLLDFGCIRKFPTRFIGGVVELRRGLLEDNRDRVVNAYRMWGFQNLTNDIIDTMNIWAKFIYGPLLDDREREIADGVAPGDYGRKEAIAVRNALQEKGPVTVPREFVFMDRAAIGLGGVFLHLRASVNWYRLFEETLANFSDEATAARQKAAFETVGIEVPA
jgi:predicted unusual protein kinase regulating ubiquinone biosynthesis (AarF/ABC1/UbiB family)